MSVEIQTDIQHFSVETQTEAIIFSVSFKHKRMHQVFGYQRFPPRYLINQLNGNRQASLPRAEVIFNALSVQGRGRVTILGRGHGHSNALGRGAVGHLSPGNGN